jgi:PAS domain S-box-containing protein
MASRVREAIDVLTRSGEAAFAIDSTDRLIYWNPGCEKLLGLPAQKVLGKHCFEVMNGRDVNGNVYCYRNCPVAHQARQETEDDVRPFLLRVVDAEGAERTLNVSMFAVPAVRAADSAVIHVVRKHEDRPADVEEQLAQITREAPEPRWQLGGNGESSSELSDREKEVLRCMAEGLSTSTIAKKLFISPVTVRNHTQNILQKLDVHTKLAAVVYAFRHEIL